MPHTHIDMAPMQNNHLETAASILADAFADDPDADVIVKGTQEKKLRILRRHYRNLTALHLSRGNCVSALLDGVIVGVMLFSAPSVETVTNADILRLTWSMLFHAGPAVIWRGLRSSLDDERHRPKEVHYYLETLGVVPKHQGAGVGSAMVSHLIERAEREQVLIYLSTTNPKTIPLYERLGFQIKARTAPNRVPNFHMVRSPRQK